MFTDFFYGIHSPFLDAPGWERAGVYMKKIVQVFDKPGKYEVVIPFDKVGEEKNWIGIVKGIMPGEYELHVTADHQVPGTTGRITVRGVAGKDVVVKLYGMIRIRKEAQQTDDFLELRVLTLDKTARAIAEPQLEIEANDVKASHAASVGQVDAQQVLYLMSRGISDKSAKDEIVAGWLGV